MKYNNIAWTIKRRLFFCVFCRRSFAAEFCRSEADNQFKFLPPCTTWVKLTLITSAGATSTTSGATSWASILELFSLFSSCLSWLLFRLHGRTTVVTHSSRTCLSFPIPTPLRSHELPRGGKTSSPSFWQGGSLLPFFPFSFSINK